MPTKTWVGTAGGGWATASNWSPASLPSATDDIIFNSSNNNSSIINGSYTINSIDFSDYSGNLNASNGSLSLTIAGSNDGTATGVSLRLSSTMTITLTPIFTFTSSVGGYIYCNGKTLLNAVTFNNATGVWSNQDILTISFSTTITAGTLTAGASIVTTTGSLLFTAGTLNFGSYTHSFNIFSSSNANTRTINFGTSTVNITGNATTVWTTGIVTGLTVLGTSPTVNFTYSGSTGSRTISMGALSEANSISVNISAGSDAITLAGASFKSLNFTGYSGSCPLGNNTIYKDLTLSPTQTLSSSGTLNFAGTSVTQTITSSGLTIPTATFAINSATTTVQTVGSLTTTGALALITGTFIINGNLTIGSASTLTLTAGTMTVNNGANITCGLFSSNTTNTRVLNMGWGTWTITGAGTIWNINGTAGITLNAQQSRILINNTSVTTNTFTSTGSLTYYTIEYARGGGGGRFDFTGSTSVTITNFIDTTSTAAHQIGFGSGTYNFYKFNVRGSAGALVTIARSGATSPIINKVGQGIVPYCDYLNIVSTTFTATPANTWYAGANSTGSGGGWVMTAAPTSQSLLGAGGVG